MTYFSVELNVKKEINIGYSNDILLIIQDKV
jgi:hypothetical protein